MHWQQAAARLKDQKQGHRQQASTQQEGTRKGRQRKTGPARQAERRGAGTAHTGDTPQAPTTHPTPEHSKQLGRRRHRPRSRKQHHEVTATRRLRAHDPAQTSRLPRSVVILCRLQAAHGQHRRRQLTRMKLPAAAARVLKPDLSSRRRDDSSDHSGSDLAAGVIRHARIPDGMQREQAQCVPHTRTRLRGLPRRARLARDDDAGIQRRRRAARQSSPQRRQPLQGGAVDGAGKEEVRVALHRNSSSRRRRARTRRAGQVGSRLSAHASYHGTARQGAMQQTVAEDSNAVGRRQKLERSPRVRRARRRRRWGWRRRALRRRRARRSAGRSRRRGRRR